MIVSVRNVDEKLFKEFSIEAKRKDMAVGEAVTEAMKLWLHKQPAKIVRLRDIKPWSFGPGTEDISQNIDEIAYGENAR